MNPFFMKNAMAQMGNLMQQMQNPQQLVQRIIPDVPKEIMNDPNQIINWLQQTGRITPQQIQQAQMMMGRR